MLSDIENGIRRKIESIGIQLKDWEISINYGIKTGFNEAFIITKEQRDSLIILDPKSEEIIRPLLRGRDIKRYHYEYADLYLIATFPSLKINIDHYSAVKQHLLSFGYDRLKQTGDKGARKKTNNKWFETQDSISYWEDFNRQKIVWGNLNLRATYAIAEPGIFINAPSPIIVPANKYLLAILNSKLADYYIRSLGVTRNGGYFEYKPMFIEKLPVPQLTDNLQSKFISLADDVINAVRQNKNSSHIETEINNLVYKLYELDKDEIDFIEGLSE